MGPLLLSRLMGLREAQEGALNIAFKLADEEGLAILDLKDLRALLSDLAERGKEIRTDYGNVSTVTIGSIQRRLVVLEEQGAENFFGEPALDIKDFMRTDTRRPRLHQYPRRRQADELAAALRNVPALAAFRAVRGTARSRRSGKAAARVLLRRGASALCRCAAGPAPENRAGREARPLERRGRLFRHPESARYPESRFSPSSATEFSMRCAPIRRASRRR